MVPEVRIELTADPYQGSVLPLNYTGVQIDFSISLVKGQVSFCQKIEK